MRVIEVSEDEIVRAGPQAARPSFVEVDPAEVVRVGRQSTSALREVAPEEVQRFNVPRTSGIVGGYDISQYATDPQHERKIASLLNSMDFKTIEDVDAYIKRVAPDSPVTGAMIAASAQKHGVDIPMMVALMQNDSQFGTMGKGARTFNPGNVGNDDTGREVSMGTWDTGVDAVAEWLSRHKAGNPIQQFAMSQIRAGKTPEEALSTLRAETKGLRTVTGPAELLAGGVGGVGRTLVGKGMALAPALARGALSGAVGIAPEVTVIDPLAEKAGEIHPALDTAVGLGLGLLSGATIESAAEKAIAGAAGKVARAVPEIGEILASEAGSIRVPGGKAPGTTPKPVSPQIPADVGAYRAKVLSTAQGLVDDARKLPAIGKYVDSINVDRLDTPEDADRLMQVISERLQPHINAQRRGKITHDELTEMAARSGVSEEDLIKRGVGENWNAEKALASRMVNAASVTNLMRKRDALLSADAAGKITDEQVVDFHRALVRHQIVQSAEAGLATEAGRALGARRIIVSPEMQAGRNIKGMLDALGGKEPTVEIARRMSMIDPMDTYAVNKFIRSVHEATTWEKIYEAWINSLLSAPTTHVANWVSNSLTFLSKFPEKAMSGAVDAVSSTLTGKARQRYAGEVAEELFSLNTALKRAWEAAKVSFINEMPSDAVSKIEVGRGPAIKGTKGEVVRLPSRFLMAADEFWKAMNYTAEIHGLAFRKATQKGLSGDAKAKYIAELIANPSKVMDEAARHEMLYRVFQDLGKVAAHVSAARRDDPTKVLQVVLPFLRTPVNIAKYGLERTPLGFLHIAAKALQKDLKPGQAADEAGRALLGTMIGAMVYGATSEGVFTGAGPQDQAKRAALYRTGWQPYSAKIGDTYYSFQRFEPLSSVVGMASDLAEGFREMSDDEKENIATRIIKSVGNNITSKTFAKGLSDALMAWTFPERYGSKWVEGLAGSVVPTGVANVARAGDPYMRDTKRRTLEDEVTAYIQSRLPGYRKNLPVRRDIFGEGIEQPGNAFTRMVLPVNVSETKNDPVNLELNRLKNIAAIGETSRTIRGQLGDMELSPEEYGRLLQEIGHIAKPLLKNVIHSKEYRSLPDEQKAEILRGIYGKVAGQQRQLAYVRSLIQRNRQKKTGD